MIAPKPKDLEINWDDGKGWRVLDSLDNLLHAQGISPQRIAQFFSTLERLGKAKTTRFQIRRKTREG